MGNCRYAYFLKYIRKIDPIVNKAMMLGEVCHFICDQAIQRGINLENINEYTLRELSFNSEYAQYISIEEIAPRLPAIISYLKIINNFKVGWYSSEFRFGLDSNLALIPFFDNRVKFRGVMDFISISKERTVIIDLKSSFNKDNWNQIQYYTLFPKIRYPLYGGIFSMKDNLMYWKRIVRKTTLDEFNEKINEYDHIDQFTPNYHYCPHCFISQACDKKQ
jgi:hypothetical protein